MGPEGSLVRVRGQVVDPADQPVAFLAAHVQEHALMLVLQQSARKMGVQAPAIVSSCRFGPKAIVGHRAGHRDTS